MGGATTGRRTARVVVCALPLLAIATPSPAPAQQAPTPTDELTAAILRYAFRFDGGNARLVPGRVPDDLAPNFYAPRGTRVVGTIVGGSSAVVLAATDAPADSVHAEYRRALDARGWKAWDRSPEGGFVSSRAESPLIFCREGAHLHITHRRRATPPHDLQLEYRETGTMCEDRPTAERAEFVRMDRPRFPTLRSPDPPVGRPTQTCYSRGSSRFSRSMGTGTLVSTELQPAELLQYFGRQLEAAGWSSPTRGGRRATVSGTWTRSDSTGGSQVVTLDVTERGPGSGCYDVQMNVSR